MYAEWFLNVDQMVHSTDGEIYITCTCVFGRTYGKTMKLLGYLQWKTKQRTASDKKHCKT